MTVTGQISSYGLAGGVPVEIDVMIDMLDPTELPLQNGWLPGNVRALPRFDIGNTKYEWQDDTLLDPVSTVDEGGTFSSGDTTLTVADGTRFKAGDVIYIEDEALYVSAVSTNDLTVVRGFAGTTDANHADGSDIICIGQALPEGSDAIESSHVDRTRRYNHTQIFGPRKVRVTGTEQNMLKYGLVRGGEGAYQFDKELIQLGRGVERALLYSKRYDDGADQRTMGGFDYFISTNEDSSSTALTKANITTQLQAMFDAGATPGMGYVGLMSMANKIALGDLDNTLIRLDRVDNGRGQMVDYLDTDVGRIYFLTSRFMRNSDVFIYDYGMVSFGAFRNWMASPLAKTGDADTMMAVGEFGFRLKRERHAAKFTALTT